MCVCVCVRVLSEVMFCVGRDRSLQCARSSLKSSATSTIRFCREHAPAGSTDIEETKESDRSPAHHEQSGQVVARRPQSQSSVDDPDDMSEDFDDTADRKTLLVLLCGRNSDRTSVMPTALYIMSGLGLDDCRTPGCERAARDGGYCVSCQNRQTGRSSLPAISYPDEDMASADDFDEFPISKLNGNVSSEPPIEEVEAHSSLQSSEVDVDNAELQQLADSSSGRTTTADITHPLSVRDTKYVDMSLCRGPYCNNTGLEKFRGLCKACYRTLLVANFGLRHGTSPDDIGAGLD